MSQEFFIDNNKQNKVEKGVPFDPNNSERVKELSDKFEPKGILGRFKEWSKERGEKESLRRNCRICQQAEATRMNVAVPHDCKDHQMK